MKMVIKIKIVHKVFQRNLYLKVKATKVNIRGNIRMDSYKDIANANIVIKNN